jgi:single-stranded DNA-binding protein
MIISLVGNVGNVRVFTGEDGKKAVLFSVAVDQKAANGEKAAPIWYSFRAVNGLAETLSQYLTKGRLVYVAGTSPRIRQYEVERTLNVAGVGTVKFKDIRQEVEYLLTDFRFLDAPATQAAPQVIEAQVVAPAAQAATAQAAPQATPQTVAQASLKASAVQVAQAAQAIPEDLPF